jgi:hypothetical protein
MIASFGLLRAMLFAVDRYEIRVSGGGHDLFHPTVQQLFVTRPAPRPLLTYETEVLGGGLEPPCLAAYAPQTYVSAISPPERLGQI